MNAQFLMKINYFIALLFLITIHEAAHAWMAERCGDSTGRDMGRITLNPIPHLDPIGTVLIPLVMIFTNPQFAIIGWGKPCPVDPRNYKNYKRDDILVSLAGPLINLIVSILSLFLIRFAREAGLGGNMGLINFLSAMSYMGFGLCVFNLIPLPPLDGSHVLKHVLPREYAKFYHTLERYSMLILLVLINTPFLDYFFKPAFVLFNLTANMILN